MIGRTPFAASRRMGCAAAFLMLTSIALTPAAMAGGVSVDDGSSSFQVVASNDPASGKVWNSLSQSFTADDTRIRLGMRLKDIDASLPHAGTLIVYNLYAGENTYTSLVATKVVVFPREVTNDLRSASGDVGFVEADFLNVALVIGQKYTIEVTLPQVALPPGGSDSGVAVWKSLANPYSGGGLYLRSGYDNSQLAGQDMLFRTMSADIWADLASATYTRPVADNSPSRGSVWNSISQSFTAEHTKILFGFRFLDYDYYSAPQSHAGDLVVYNLYAGSNSYATLLASRTVVIPIVVYGSVYPLLGDIGFVYADFSDVTLTTGQKYTVELTVPPSELPPEETYTGIAVFTSLSNPYAGGRFFFRSGYNNSYFATEDLSFSTLVAPTTDNTAPEITPIVVGTLGDNGWYRSDVTVGWDVFDGESAISSSSGCGNSSITTDTSGITVTCMATSLGGNSTRSVTIKIDRANPVVPFANQTFFLLNSSNSYVEPAARDELSGISSQSCEDAITTSAAPQLSTACVAQDFAGNRIAFSRYYGINYVFKFLAPLEKANSQAYITKGRKLIPFRWRLTDANGAPVTTLASASIGVFLLASQCPNSNRMREISEYGRGVTKLENYGDGTYSMNYKIATTWTDGFCRYLNLDVGDAALHYAQFRFDP